MMQLELESHGTFLVGASKDDSCRCGPLYSSRQLWYKARVVTTPDKLNEKGFVIDWQDVNKYFKQMFSQELDTFPSCERIAVQACVDLVKLLDGRALELCVTIGGTKVPAGMSATWRKSGVRIL